MFLGFGRVYSGALGEGRRVRDQRPYDPSEPDDGSCEEIVVELYLMMGQGMFRVKEVPAEYPIVGGLDRHV